MSVPGPRVGCVFRPQYAPEKLGAAARAADAAGLAEYTPEEVAKRTGVKAERIERLAREFAENSPSIALIGGTPLAHTNGMFSALAVKALHALAGTTEQLGGISFMPQPKLSNPADR